MLGINKPNYSLCQKYCFFLSNFKIIAILWVHQAIAYLEYFFQFIEFSSSKNTRNIYTIFFSKTLQ